MAKRPAELSRREQQIMDIVYALGQATVAQVHERMAEAPTTMAVRRTMHILEEKKQLKRKLVKRTVVYLPRHDRGQVGAQAFQNVLDTFFDGSVEDALASHFMTPGDALSPDERRRIRQLIEQLRQKEEES